MIAGIVPVERDVTVRHPLAHAAASEGSLTAQALRRLWLSTWSGWLQAGCHPYPFAVDDVLHVAAGQTCAVDNPGYRPASSNRLMVVAESYRTASVPLTAAVQQAPLRVRRGLPRLAHWWTMP